MIGFETLNAATTLVRMLLESHENDINKAYSKAYGQFSIALNIKMKPSEVGGVDVDVSMTFVSEKIKDSLMRNVCEGQDELFEKMKDGEVSFRMAGRKEEVNQR